MRAAFGSGAEYAVTHMESPRERTLHRLECPALEPHLDRHAQWTADHRRRLLTDGRHRLSVPALITRDSARGLSGVRSCKVCWPNVHGTDPRPLRELQARGLRAHHVGHMLSTGSGESLGTIVRSAQHSGTDLFGVKQEVGRGRHDLAHAAIRPGRARVHLGPPDRRGDHPAQDAALPAPGIRRDVGELGALRISIARFGTLLWHRAAVIRPGAASRQWNTDRAVTVTSIGTASGSSSVCRGACHTDRSVTVAVRPSSDAARTSSRSSRSLAASAR